MEKKDIMHLASLARIRITDSEAEALLTDIDGVLAYVSTVNDITADVALTKKPGVVRNVFREDAVANAPEEYTDALLKEAPQIKGRFLKVKKILQQD
jgi:aspartyl-tRNA(Asn)/glutamyl-tRNA(Gln) amidotransferase subunit C